MNASEAQVVHGSADNAVLKRMAGELMGEAAGSVAVIALAIAALAGVQPYLLAGIATIVLGAAVLIEGGVLDGREVIERGELASTEFLGGFAGIILGILALLGIASMTLLSVAVIVFAPAFFSAVWLEETTAAGRWLESLHWYWAFCPWLASASQCWYPSRCSRSEPWN